MIVPVRSGLMQRREKGAGWSAESRIQSQRFTASAVSLGS
jgi:hypothetical protein